MKRRSADEPHSCSGSARDDEPEDDVTESAEGSRATALSSIQHEGSRAAESSVQYDEVDEAREDEGVEAAARLSEQVHRHFAVEPHTRLVTIVTSSSSTQRGSRRGL